MLLICCRHLDRIDQRALPLDEQFTASALGSGVDVFIVSSGVRGDHEEFAALAGAGAGSRVREAWSLPGEQDKRFSSTGAERGGSAGVEVGGLSQRGWLGACGMDGSSAARPACVLEDFVRYMGLPGSGRGLAPTWASLRLPTCGCRDLRP